MAKKKSELEDSLAATLADSINKQFKGQTYKSAFFLDGDDAGRKAVGKYSKELYKLLPDVKISMVNTPENEDVNSIVQKEEFNLEEHDPRNVNWIQLDHIYNNLLEYKSKKKLLDFRPLPNETCNH